MQFDHLTIRTGYLRATKTFFEKVLDLVEGERPAIIQHIPGHWLFDDGKPVVHLIASSRGSIGNSLEAIDHIGIRPKESYGSFRARLEQLSIPYSLMDVVELNERRIFFRTPGGSLLEAVFDEVVPSINYSKERKVRWVKQV